MGKRFYASILDLTLPSWPMLREALKHMGRADLIGSGKKHLVPAWQPGSAQRPFDRFKTSTAKPNRVLENTARQVVSKAPKRAKPAPLKGKPGRGSK